MPQAAGVTHGSILDRLADCPQFKQRRELALTRPERARDKLESYSTLELKVVKARNLPAADVVSSDPYTEVYVDDVLKDQTSTVFKSLNPVWNWEKTIEIKHPASFLLLRVMDYDVGRSPDVLGFVEFPVTDLPVDTSTAGWFRLLSPKKLVGQAPQRLSKISDLVEEKCGAIYLEVTRRIVSGDIKDEQYAWCLPDPKPFEYPEGGCVKSLDAQALIDSVMDFKAALVGGLIRPLMTGVGYILGWHNVPMTLVVLVIGLGVSYRPDLFVSGLLLMAGLLLLMMADPRVSAAMSLQPATVPLDDTGYKLIAQTSNTDATVAYLQRVAFSLQGDVTDADKLRKFAAFASHKGQVVAESYADLKQQLHKARVGTGVACEVLKLKDKPLKKGVLVQRGGRKGEIVGCVNQAEVLTWRYEVQFDGADKPEVVCADELDPRTDMRWMSGGAVLALVPNSVEDSLNGWTAFLRSLTATLEGVLQPVRDIAGWKDQGKSLMVALACLALSVLFVWIQRALFLALVPLLFAKNTELWTSFSARRRGMAAFKKQVATRDVSEWGFFVRAEADEVSSSSSGLLRSVIDKARSTLTKK